MRCNWQREGPKLLKWLGSTVAEYMSRRVLQWLLLLLLLLLPLLVLLLLAPLVDPAELLLFLLPRGTGAAAGDVAGDGACDVVGAGGCGAGGGACGGAGGGAGGGAPGGAGGGAPGDAGGDAGGCGAGRAGECCGAGLGAGRGLGDAGEGVVEAGGAFVELSMSSMAPFVAPSLGSNPLSTIQASAFDVCPSAFLRLAARSSISFLICFRIVGTSPSSGDAFAKAFDNCTTW